ncbi:hypothetical protein PMAYCL1PPCAC_19789, partial [Pristionchus mayeri]
FAFVKGDCAFGMDHCFVAVSANEQVLKKTLNIPATVQQGREGFKLATSPIAVMEILERKGWRVVGVAGPWASSNIYMWTLQIGL